MIDRAVLAFDDVVQRLRAAAEDTRLRILALLTDGELTVSELTDILRQSQPRVSRHLKLLAESGLIARTREGAWAFFRLADDPAAHRLVGEALSLIRADDPMLSRDRARRQEVRATRAAAAQDFFRRIAPDWDRVRRLHVDEALVDQAVQAALAGRKVRTLLDLGTGTGRILQLFGPSLDRGLGIDLSPAMLSVARANLDRAGLTNCTVRQGDIFDLALGADRFDAVIVHQVLHFLEDGAKAIREAAVPLKPGGRLVVIDFAPHEQEFLRETQAHRRLGFARETIEGWLLAAGLDPVGFQLLDPPADAPEGLAVSIWTAADRRMPVSEPVPFAQEVA
jgi:ubiquinone/menaquinone biosynthesis C-methylase UbiE/DNA-binding transcriptional ArsR family regulator